MPEGDNIHGLALRLRDRLVDRPIDAVWARSAALEAWLQGTVVQDVRAVGKHLLLHSGDHILRVHLGLHGSWTTRRRPHRSGSTTALMLTCGEWSHQLSSPRDLERFHRRQLPRHRVLASLGPDLATPDADLDEVLRRASLPEYRRHMVADLLLNQRVAAGLGNVYKCELLFMHRLHPRLAVEVAAPRLRAVFEDGHRLLQANIGRVQRRTRRRGQPLWVYGRRGPCPICATPIRREPFGHPYPRTTSWCPSCQSVTAPG